MREPRIITMSIASAELSKYAANAMLATRISFMNEMAGYCDAVGADIEEIRKGIGADSRIGSAFLYAGLGYGGSCFPKDLKAIIGYASAHGYDFALLRAVEQVNQQQRERMLDKVRQHFGGDLQGRRFAVWGLSFKPHTDDIREAPAIDIIKGLLAAGSRVSAFDPVAMENARTVLGAPPEVTFAKDRYEALQGADALLLVTEWPVFRKPDFERVKSLLKQPVIFDGRNQYNPESLRKLGLTLYSMGRGQH
jgi:UDPglucose 6-dehydrogenase